MDDIEIEAVETVARPLGVDGCDWQLQYLVEAVNRLPNLPLSVTLNSGGMLVSGQLISARQYTKEVIEAFRIDGFDEDELLNIRKLYFVRLIRQYYDNAEAIISAEDMDTFLTLISDACFQNDETNAPFDLNSIGYIHLKDAKFFPGTTGPIISAGTLWRGPLKEVSGFFMGQMALS